MASVIHLHQIVMASASQMAVAAAKAGLEFKSLKRDVGHGAWEHFFDVNFGGQVTLRTAQRYMALADGLKGRALKNDTAVSLLELLDSAPSALSEENQAALTKAVSKAMDGKSLSELYQDLGIVKKPQGGAAKGGNTRKPLALGNGKPADESEDAAESEDAPQTQTAEVVAEGHRASTRNLISRLQEAIKDEPYNAADKADRKKLHGLLVDLAAAVSATLT